MELRIVVDIDDVISVHENRDYSHAKPFNDVICKINHLHDDMGFTVVLYTSRGMFSCNGDVAKAKSKNEPILLQWLKDNDVHFDELQFGKPLADMYIDDKCMNKKQFLSSDFKFLRGGSGHKICKIGNVVKKEIDESKIQKIKYWFEQSEGICYRPSLISSLYNCLYFEWIEGENLSNCIYDFGDIRRVMNIVENFSMYKYDSFDMNLHSCTLMKNKGIEKSYRQEVIDGMIDACEYYLKDISSKMKDCASFSHSDLTLSNIILQNTTMKLYFIDPEMDKDASSYLLDYAKLRMSMMGYEYKFGLSLRDNSIFLKEFDDVLIGKGIYKEVVILNLMYVLRLWRYKDNHGRNVVLNMAKEVFNTLSTL